MAEPKDLVGTWRMLSWKKKTVSSGETVDAHGPNPVGYLSYGADGRVQAIVVRRDRPAPETLPPTDTGEIRQPLASIIASCNASLRWLAMKPPKHAQSTPSS